MLSTLKKTAWLQDTVFLSILIGVFYFLFLGSYPLFTPDEGRYSEVAREMLLTSDFITPRLNGIPFLDKPILYYWLQASAIKIFGLKEWSLRFWPVTIGILGCLSVYLAGFALFGRRAGILSAIILATSPLYYSSAHYANLDLEVAVFVSMSLLAFIVGFQKEYHKHRNKLLFLAYTFSALAILTKGLLGLLFPILIIGSFILLTTRFNIILKMKLIPGLLLVLAITTPWFYLVQKANPQFFNYFFVMQQFSRFLTTAKFNNQTTVWFYIPILALGFFPWIVFFLQSASVNLAKIIKNKSAHSAELFLLLWFALIFTFFSIPKSKTIGYILPTLPAMALLTGKYLSDYYEIAKNFGIKTGINAFIVLSLGIGFLLVASPQYSFMNIPYKIMSYLMSGGIVLVLSAISCYFALKTNKLSLVFCCISLASAGFLTCFILSAHTINHKSMKPLAAVINEKIKPNDEIATYFRYYQDLPIYTKSKITVAADWKADDIIDYDNWQRELWFHKQYVENPYWLIEEEKLIEKWDSDKRIFLIVYLDMLSSFLTKYKVATNKSPETFFLGSVTLNDSKSIVLISNKDEAIAG